MKTRRLFAAIALLGAALSLAGAQGFRMMGGGGAMSQGMVLFNFGQGGMEIRADVSKELKLSDAQKTKLNDFQQQQMQEMMGMFQGGERPSPEQMQAIMKKRQDAEDKSLKETLDETQRKRLKELWIQRMGNGAILNADIQKELALTEDQKKKARDLQTKQGEANRSIMDKVRGGEMDFSEVRPLMEKNNTALNVELGKLLTKEQTDKLKTMGGAAFKFEDNNG